MQQPWQVGDQVSKTRDSLGIFWEGEEVDGLTAYGFWPREVAVPPESPTDLWPPDATIGPWKLWGERWTVWLWDVRVRSWPVASEWVRVVSSTLETLRAAGADVAWCGVEGCFVDPPALFDPMRMANGVWACRTAGGLVFAPPALESEMRYLGYDELARVHAEITAALQRAEDTTKG